MARFLTLLYGLLGYAIFFATFLYLIAFVTGLPLAPFTTYGGGPEAPLGEALLVNVGLVALFGVQHSIMARGWFKRWFTRFVPAAIERTTFMLVTCAIFALMFTQWRIVPGTAWKVDGALGLALDAVGYAGWGIALLSTFLIDHFDLFGLRQTWLAFRGRPYARKPFVERSLYRVVRHPLMLGFVLAMWCGGDMSISRLILAAAYLLYIVIALFVEERELIAIHGDAYRDYQRRVPKLVPLRVRAPSTPVAEVG